MQRGEGFDNGSVVGERTVCRPRNTIKENSVEEQFKGSRLRRYIIVYTMDE